MQTACGLKTDGAQGVEGDSGLPPRATGQCERIFSKRSGASSSPWDLVHDGPDGVVGD